MKQLLRILSVVLLMVAMPLSVPLSALASGDGGGTGSALPFAPGLLFAATAVALIIFSRRSRK